MLATAAIPRASAFDDLRRVVEDRASDWRQNGGGLHCDLWLRPDGSGQEGGIARISPAGVMCAIGSGLCFAFYTAYGKQVLKSYDPRTMITYTFLTSAVVWLTIRPPWKIDWAGINFSMWVFFIYLAGVATILPFALYSASLRHLEASRSSLTSMLEPVVAASVAWLWLGEKMEPMQIAGGAAVVGGVLLLQIESQMRRRNGGMERLRDGERESERAGEWETND